VLDSVSSIEHATSTQGFRQFMVGLASLLREHGRSALLTQTIGTFNAADTTAPYLSTIPDAILLMDYSFAGRELERSMRVLKMRGSSHATERRKIVIEPGGIRVELMPG
jgi:circadian clock protein KaiC